MPQNILNLIQKIHSLQFITMDSSDTRVEGWLKWEEQELIILIMII